MKKFTKNIKVILSIVFLVGAVINGIIITLYNVDKSVNLDEITKEMTETKDVLNSLNENVSASDSLINFLNKSSDNGFTDRPQVLYFSQTDSLAHIR